MDPLLIYILICCTCVKFDNDDTTQLTLKKIWKSILSESNFFYLLISAHIFCLIIFPTNWLARWLHHLSHCFLTNFHFIPGITGITSLIKHLLLQYGFGFQTWYCDCVLRGNEIQVNLNVHPFMWMVASCLGDITLQSHSVTHNLCLFTLPPYFDYLPEILSLSYSSF